MKKGFAAKGAMKVVTLPIPFVIENGGKYLAAWSPVLEIATQGRDEKELRKNIHELVKMYFEDPDTKKPTQKAIMNMSISITNVPVEIPESAWKHEAPCSVSS